MKSLSSHNHDQYKLWTPLINLSVIEYLKLFSPDDDQYLQLVLEHIMPSHNATVLIRQKNEMAEDKTKLAAK